MSSFTLPYVRPGYTTSNGGRIIDLIMQSGRQQAEAARRSGELWGNFIPAIGQRASSALQQMEESKRQSARSMAFEQALTSEDPKAILRVLGPKDGPPVINAIRALEPDRQKQYSDKMQLFRDVASGIMHAPKDSRAKSYSLARQQLISGGVIAPEEVPEEYEEGFVTGLAKYGEKAPSMMSVSPGAAVFDPSTGQEVYRAPEKPVTPSFQAKEVLLDGRPALANFDSRTGRYLAGDQDVTERVKPVPNEPRHGAQKSGLSPGAPKSGLSPTAESNIINRLSGQWTRAAAPVAEISRQVKLMDVGLDAARRGDMAAGSQAILVTFQKILDPPSVVRESEYMRGPAGQALLARIRGAFERVKSGGAGVPLDELEKFARLAREAAQAQSMGYIDSVRQRVGMTADRYGIPRELVIDDFDFDGGAAQAAGMPRISSDADYAKLPAGTVFIDPDGKRRKKP